MGKNSVNKFTFHLYFCIIGLHKLCTFSNNCCASFTFFKGRFPDVLIVQGKYQFQPPFPFSPGGEIAGVISEVGEGVVDWKIGDRVIAMTGNGGIAEKVVAFEMTLMPLPETMDFKDGAAFPLNYGTTYHALKQRGQLQAGETLLVTGAGGGVGTTAIEIGKAMGARVIATASTDEKCNVAKEHGADEIINYSNGEFKETVKSMTDGKGADVIYDSVGKNTIQIGLSCLTERGKLISYGNSAGAIEAIDISSLKPISGSLVCGGLLTFIKNREERQNNADELFKLIINGKLKIDINQRYKLKDIAIAHDEVEARITTGSSIILP